MPNPSEHCPDFQLIAACVAGDPGAWNGLSQGYGKWLEKVVSFHLHKLEIKDGNAVKEVMANVWSELWRNRELAEFQFERATLRTYLRGVAKKQVLLWLRQKRMARDLQHLSLSPIPDVTDQKRCQEPFLAPGFISRVRSTPPRYFCIVERQKASRPMTMEGDQPVSRTEGG